MQGDKLTNNFMDNEDFDDSYDWREQQNQIAQFKTARLKDLFPVNYQSQKAIFFQKKCQYNPHFCYNTIVSPQLLTLSTQYQQLAMKILLNNKHSGSSLPLLKEQQVIKIVEDYLQKLGLHQYVEIKLQSHCLSRTSISFFKEKAVLKMRTPVEYNKIDLEGVLNHEIGTHILRRLNHKDNCVRKPSQKGKLIQEGLAAINQLIVEEKPFLFKAALRYVAAIYASKYSFSHVYKNISKYLKDASDCWRQTVRVKRGLGNTQEPGGYYKDQSYLIGATQILKDRKNIDFRKIYYGKLAPSETLHLNNGVLPPFIDSQQKYRYYLKKLDVMALCNFID